MTTTGAFDVRSTHVSTMPLDVDVSLQSGSGAHPGAKRFASDSGFIDLNDLGDGAGNGFGAGKTGKR